MARRLNPIEHVIKTIGGVRRTARAIGRQPSNISCWRSQKGGCGKIPRAAQEDILKYALSKKLDITAEDLILGRSFNSKAKRG